MTTDLFSPINQLCGMNVFPASIKICCGTTSVQVQYLQSGATSRLLNELGFVVGGIISHEAPITPTFPSRVTEERVDLFSVTYPEGWELVQQKNDSEDPMYILLDAKERMRAWVQGDENGVPMHANVFTRFVCVSSLNQNHVPVSLPPAVQGLITEIVVDFSLATHNGVLLSTMVVFEEKKAEVRTSRKPTAEEVVEMVTSASFETAGEEWLNEHKPRWRDPLFGWDL